MQIQLKSRPGFTIVEMLVVIGIIAVMIGLLLPALSSAQARGMKMREMSAVRQVGTAWILYSNQNRDTILPGYLEHDPSNVDVQDLWRTQYEYPFAPLIDPSNPDAGQLPREIPKDIAAPWPWRLLEYLDYEYNVLLGYRVDDDQSPMALVNRADTVAHEPGFGYNAYYLGGWLTVGTQTGSDPSGGGSSGSGTVVPRFWNVQDAVTGKRVTVVHTRQSSLRQPAGMVAFCTSSEFEGGENFNARRVDDDRAGSFLVTPGYLAEELQWASADWVTVAANPSYVPIGRYNGEIVILHADGSAGSARHDDLRGQAVWIDGINDPEFQHTDDE